MTNTNSPIQWTDVTLNAIVGCDYVSTGCLHCYAATLHNRRYLAWKRGTFPTAPQQYHQPFKRVQLLPERLLTPFKWRKPQKVFFNSMSDLWHEDVPDWFIARSWALMALTPQHTYQILTKRPERMRDWLMRADESEIQASIMAASVDLLSPLPWRQRDKYYAKLIDNWQWPLPNVWLGVSVEDQAAADERIPLLLQTPAAVRFISAEPLLGPVDLGPWVFDWTTLHKWSDGSDAPRLDWVIIGGESGPHARAMNARWAESLVAQCREADVAVFMKQLGTVWAKSLGLKDRHGGDMAQWPADLYGLRVREFPLTDTLMEAQS